MKKSVFIVTVLGIGVNDNPYMDIMGVYDNIEAAKEDADAEMRNYLAENPDLQLVSDEPTKKVLYNTLTYNNVEISVNEKPIRTEGYLVMLYAMNSYNTRGTEE